MCKGFQFGMMQSSRDGKWWRFQNNMKVLSVTDHICKIVKIVNYIILPQVFKLLSRAMHVKTIRYASGDRRSSNLDWEPWVRRGSGIRISATTLVSLTLLKFENCRKGQWIKIQTVRGNETRNKHLCTYLEFSTAVKSTLLGKTSKNTMALLSFWKGQGRNLWSFTSQGLEALRRKSSKTRMPVPRHYIQVSNFSYQRQFHSSGHRSTMHKFLSSFFFNLSLTMTPSSYPLLLLFPSTLT